VGLLRAVFGLIVLVILAHFALLYVGYTAPQNVVVSAIYRLGPLFESPARRFVTAGFYETALAAAGGYFVVYLLLGALRRRIF